MVVWGASGWEVCLLSGLLRMGGMDELSVFSFFSLYFEN